MRDKIVIATIVFVIVIMVVMTGDPPQDQIDPIVTLDRAQHILYGDNRGGGHLHGVNKPCKSEFPDDWEASEVIEKVTTLAANDNAPWREQDNGYHVSEQNIDGVRVRVVLNENRTRVITAYPTNGDRNPCIVKK